MSASTSSLLNELQELKYDFEPSASARKVTLLEQLEKRRLRDAGELYALHETLCFMRAHPDDPAILGAVRRILASFDTRSDLRRQRHSLADSGIAGTVTDYRFYWLMAVLLAKRWPDFLSIVWSDFERKKELVEWLHLLLPFAETPSLDVLHLSPREWVELLKGPGETDAAFVIRRFAALRVPTSVREALYEHMDIPIRLSPGPTTPARGREHWADAPVVFRRKPPEFTRPNLREAVDGVRLRVRVADRRQARELIDLANACMVSRHRDLLIFLYADERDVRIIDCGDGLQFACIGALPAHRLVLEAVYGFLTLMNGVPTGYVLCSALFNSSEIAYNVFETFRGVGAAQTYAAVLSMVRRLFDADTFSIDPYQLGHNNEEGQRSGAWWFYYKLGFRPHDPGVRKLVRAELAKLKEDPGYRTPSGTLQRLSAEYMFLHFGKARRDVLGHLDLGNIGLHTNRYLAERFGAQREEGIATCIDETKALLNLGKGRRLSTDEKHAWERWAPLVLTLPAVHRWTPGERRALREVIRAKAAKRESRFVALIDQHKRLRKALLQLADEEPPP